ncbi:hypothetical protein T02_10491 [Trichinella nativa]|uniref:Uncharacterized protein n=3 Tax=Trichinella TaxID=6333 RepID=A0A0V1LM04_9BILA|nr:hypothetical protein T05_6342 [Trichinella murrelli]KRX57660.1 hypothetical protein T09_7407 [Trichinella sp. T9]KRY15991.1 hypothetical protein T12_5539 [Trichinella patagoniensis]KRZ60518.1 hypothetical protein T02_10491 [Trichinella nativa]KRZ96020.1 hypothetical protein T08_5655 [Trichinella sp. T8]
MIDNEAVNFHRVVFHYFTSQLNFCCNPSALSVNLEPQNQDQCPLSTTQRGSFAKRKISYSPIDLTSSKPG